MSTNRKDIKNQLLAILKPNCNIDLFIEEIIEHMDSNKPNQLGIYPSYEVQSQYTIDNKPHLISLVA